MKKQILLLCFCISFLTPKAQENKEKTDEQKNVVKINLFAIALKSGSLQYERAVSKRISIAGTVRYMPKGSFPFKNTFKNYVNDPETEKQIDNIRFGNFAFMPEARFYVGRKGALHGFYIALYGSVAKYTMSLPYNYDDGGTTKTIPLSGGINTFTGGLMFGAQWKLGNRIYIDWWLLGPNYGSSDGKMNGQKTLTTTEQQSLRDEFNKLDVPLTKTSYVVDANGATLNFKGPWAGIRTGLCIGIGF